MEMALGALLDVEGAVERTLFEVIKKATEQHEVEPVIQRGISCILQSSVVITVLLGETPKVYTVRSCLQASVLLLSWNLVVGELFMGFD
jgi:hypothetical protein